MMKIFKFVLLMLALPLLVLADVSVSPLFCDHAVLAKSERTPIFGRAEAGEEVTVQLGEVLGKTTTGEDGKWRVNFDLSQVGEGPFELVIQGKNTLKYQDILVGEVWLASGQSNMQFKLRGEEDAAKFIAESANPKHRVLIMAPFDSVKPTEEIRGKWEVVGPGNAGRCSAVGYLFAKELQSELQCPVGIIENPWGGSSIEAWMPLDELEEPQDLKEACQKSWNYHVHYEETLDNYLEAFEKWVAQTDLREQLQDAPPADAVWENNQNILGLNNLGPGVIWYRKKFVLPEKLANEGGRLTVWQYSAPMVTFYIDGKEILRAEGKPTLRGDILNANLKAGEFAPGEHEFSIRVWTTLPTFGTRRLNYRLPNDETLNTDWERLIIKQEPLPKEIADAQPARPGFQSDATTVPELLYNALICSLIPFRFSGVIWYQGCNNAGTPKWYGTEIQKLIRRWRKDFEFELMPFYYCQLTNYLAKSNNPSQPGWALIRVAQEKALELPMTGQAVLLDTGEAEDIHPINKKPAGHRLAALALANVYGKDIPCQSPRCVKKSIEDGKIRLTFDFTYGGLEAAPLPETYPINKTRKQFAPLVRNSPNSEVEGFALCGKDGVWHWADAKIEGDSVVVWCDAVPEPEKVRYAMQSNPTCNLVNKAGFPCGPFEK